MVLAVLLCVVLPVVFLLALYPGAMPWLLLLAAAVAGVNFFKRE